MEYQRRPDAEKDQGTHRGCLGPADLDVVVEHVVVHETQTEGGHSHRLRDSAEAEDALLRQEAEVVERVCRVPEHVDDHSTLHPQRLLLVTRLVQLVHLAKPVRTTNGLAIRVAPPDLARPEEAALLGVLAKVADDVRLLQHEAHRVRQLELVPEPFRLLAGRGPKACETLADETGNVVAVEVVLVDGFDVDRLGRRRFMRVVGHAGLHLFSNVDNDIAIAGGVERPRRQSAELATEGLMCEKDKRTMRPVG